MVLPPSSCDTFVVLPSKTANKCMIFGKNSDRPKSEVQEIIYESSRDYPEGGKLQCTYIEIDQATRVHAVILSKPSWMWGAEMGANEFGVCIGNEAVWTKLNGDDDKEEKLLGMDLVRLGLERGATASEAVDVIANLLETYGQGGPCSDSVSSFYYHNSFLIVDPKEAWVFETAGNLWAAERIEGGFRNISNTLSIGTKITKMSANLLQHAKDSGYWDGQGEFNFAEAYGNPNESAVCRKREGAKLLEKFSSNGTFATANMFEVLRDSESGICRGADHDFPTCGSQVSVLSSSGSSRPNCHWFTGTPDPRKSVFKPFVFTQKVRISPHIQSPRFPAEEDPAKIKPRFAKKVDRRHNLYLHHERASSPTILETLHHMEAKCLDDVEAFVSESADLSEVDDLFKDAVDTELKFYK